MATGPFRFGDFELDPADRRLSRDGRTVEISGRYLDALILLVGEAGRLVGKDRFMDEVWKGVPVTDEALTQCVRTLRRALDDEAGRPRFIETVTKHGYRFIAPVERGGGEETRSERAPSRESRVLVLGAAGTVGGGAAGLVGGVLYGFLAGGQAGSGGASVLMVLACVTLLVGLVGGAGVAFGIALAGDAPWRRMLGGAAGGLIVGGLTKLLGMDAFSLLLGRAPVEITGALEGLALGAAVGFGAALGGDRLRRGAAIAGLCGAAAGAGIAMAGGRLMAGSLAGLASAFPEATLRLSTPFGQHGLWAASALEGGLFAAGVVAAMALARRRA